MFASSSLVQSPSSSSLPQGLPSLLMGPNAFGPDPSMNYPNSLLGRSQSEFNSRLLPDRISVPPGLSPFSLRPELHHHQHLHQHMHQHLVPSGPGSASGVEPAPSGQTAASSLLLGMVGYPGLSSASASLSSLPGLRPGPAQTMPLGAGSSLGLPLTIGANGAFHPKNDGSSLNPLPQMLLPPVQERLVPAHQGRGKKSGQWCAVHVRIAWEIHTHQQQQRQIQTEVQRICSGTKTAEIDRINNSLSSPSSGETSLNGHLETLYRLGLPMFGRLPFSSSTRSHLNSFPIGGLGGVMNRLSGSNETPGGGFGATSDWLRLGKSSTFSFPPAMWLSSDGGEREKDEEDRLRQQHSQEEGLRERDSESRRSSGSNKTDRTRSRSPVKPHRSKLPTSRDVDSPAHRSSSDRCASTSSDSRRHERHRNHNHSKSNSPLSGRTDSLPPPPPQSSSLGLFPGIYPLRSDSTGALASEKPFLHHPPFLWPNPFQLDSEHTRRFLTGADSEQALSSTESTFADAARLAHLDLVFRKSLSSAPPGLRLPFRNLSSSSSGFLAKAGIHSALSLPLSCFPMAPFNDLPTSPMHKVLANGHHPELR